MEAGGKSSSFRRLFDLLSLSPRHYEGGDLLKLTELQDTILVSAPNLAGERFAGMLQSLRLPFAALVNNYREKERLQRLGVRRVVEVDTIDQNDFPAPNFPIGSVFLFEDSLPLCCRYISICRSWTDKPIYVVSFRGNARMTYRGLGASHILLPGRDALDELLCKLA